MFIVNNINTNLLRENPALKIIDITIQLFLHKIDFDQYIQYILLIATS